MKNYFTKLSFYLGLAICSTQVSANNSGWISSLTLYVNQPYASNISPVAVNDNFEINEDQTSSLDVLANDTDADGDALKLISATVDNGSITITVDNLLSYTPAPDFYGQSTINYVMTDGNGGVVSATAQVMIHPVNDAAPVVTDESFNIVTSVALNNIDVLANDTDIDMDVLTIINASAQNGNVTINEDFTLSYVSSYGFTGTDKLSYVVSDGNGGETTGTVTINVYPVNAKAPVVTGQALIEILEDNSQELTLASLNVHDIDSPVDHLTLTVADGEKYSVNNNVITPNKDFYGELTVPVTVSDGQFTSEVYLAKVQVVNVNDVPKVFSYTLNVELNTSSPAIHFYSGMMYDPDIGSNMEDPRLEQFVYLFSKTATTTDSGGRTQHGQFTQVPGQKHGTFIYTPDKDFTGWGSNKDYVFFFVYDDTGARSGRGDIIIEVSPLGNKPPKITSHSSITIDEEASRTFTLNDFTIEDNDSSSFTLKVLPGNQYSVDTSTNTITLNKDIDGTATILVTVSDGNSDSAVYAATINVNPVNDAPIVFDYQQSFYQGTEPPAIHFRTGMHGDPEAIKNPALLADFSYQFVDINNSTNGKTAHGQISQAPGQAHGVFIYTPDPGFFGTDEVAFWVTDEQGLQSEQGTMTYHVLTNAPNILAQQALTVTKNDSIALYIDNFVVEDPNSSVFELMVLGGANYTHADNVVTPDNNFVGELTVPVKVADDDGNFSPEFQAKILVVADPNASKILSIKTKLIGKSVKKN